MSDEVKISYEAGSTLYFRTYNSTGQLWNGSAFENWADGNVGDYDTALTDMSSGEYLGDFPAASSGTYGVIAFEQAGGTPVITDVAVSSIGLIWWNGSAEIPSANQTDVLVAHSTTDALIAALSTAAAGILNKYEAGE